MNKSIGFIGAGNMAKAIIKGLSQNDMQNSELYVYDTDGKKTADLINEFSVNQLPCNTEIAKQCDIIVLAVKPNIYNTVLTEIKSYLNKEQIIVSLGAGITINQIENYSDIALKILRVMPNMPVSVGQGMIAVTTNENVTEEEKIAVLNIFCSLGEVDIIDESLMNMIPAVSSSSPAFVYMFIEALADGAVLQGMGRKKAYKYAAQAVLGAAQMVLEAHKHPGELKDMVCSPAGTTIEAVYSLEKSGFRGSIIEAMNICTKKTQKMACD
ncbi:pyrroline-5-carboxylate reductase [Clostridium sp. 'deep sea']|uniref:pyrroline-5-carboxylate reductase n=1 Tax=Clostridium sp. 'deep sea' TaxID=2779445 RepID=UPI0018964E8B|nr:pyrroline-5-carboxylate reductase [Clostridium sp. 'deep sea']QOR36135.1 pyrroline-5-carboxylate reductase [Clostridium sp. 'deep sea']